MSSCTFRLDTLHQFTYLLSEWDRLRTAGLLCIFSCRLEWISDNSNKMSIISEWFSYMNTLYKILHDLDQRENQRKAWNATNFRSHLINKSTHSWFPWLQGFDTAVVPCLSHSDTIHGKSTNPRNKVRSTVDLFMSPTKYSGQTILFLAN